MVENSLVTSVKPAEQRCSNCIFGHQIVAGMAGGNLEDDDTETRWYLTSPIPIGQTRNCFGWLEIVLSKLDFVELDHYVYPNEDDTCIRPRKFMPKPMSEV